MGLPDEAPECIYWDPVDNEIRTIRTFGAVKYFPRGCGICDEPVIHELADTLRELRLAIEAKPTILAEDHDRIMDEQLEYTNTAVNSLRDRIRVERIAWFAVGWFAALVGLVAVQALFGPILSWWK